MKVSAILSDAAYPALKAYIVGHTGLDYYADKDEDFASRIGRRLAARAAPDCRSYLSLLHTHEEEMERLVGELTIGETYFFRQRDHFDLLRDVVFPDLLERNRDRRSLRIWSAGCATGAEPYSIAMLLKLEMADRSAGWEISILGTDINSEFLARARVARYDHWAFRETPDDVRQRCFVPRGRQWELRREFREAVSFQQHNLAGAAPFPGAGGPPFDLAMCRNVMIYFDQERVRRTTARFHDALAEHGWLIVGHAEPNPEIFSRFETVQTPSVTVYRKPGPKASPEVSVPFRPLEHEPTPRRPEPETPPVKSRRAPARNFPRDGFTAEDARRMADRGQWSEAAELCRKLIRADNLSSLPHFTLGLVLEHVASRQEAAEEFRRAIYLERGFALAHYHLGACLQASRQAAGARKAFLNALDLLADRADEETLEHGDGITAGELKELSRMHLELLGES